MVMRSVHEEVSCYVYQFFFFFQAEDGIRDYKVTGVQTCALPIFVDADAEQKRVIGALRKKYPQYRTNVPLRSDALVIALDVRRLRHWRASSPGPDRKSTRLNSSHLVISYAVFCLKKKKR